jgi:ferredoxin
MPLRLIPNQGLRNGYAEYTKLWPNITLKKEPPADAEEWERVPDKVQYFSPNPGAGG